MIINRRTLAGLVSNLKQQNKTIVLASGAFDIIHIGHVRYLQKAAKEGDLLVVAVNSDESILQYKKSKPIVPLAERMEIVDAIKGVDFVTSFDEPTAHSIVCDLLPDVHTKGDGYSAETLPEYEFITNLGIRVVFIHGSPAHSSSTLKETIRNQNQ